MATKVPAPPRRRRSKRLPPVAPPAPAGYVNPELPYLDVLFTLHGECPKVVSKLRGGRPPDHSCVYRWSTRGQEGFRLRTLLASNRRLTCRRWLYDYWAAIEQARTRRLMERG